MNRVLGLDLNLGITLQIDVSLSLSLSLSLNLNLDLKLDLCRFVAGVHVSKVGTLSLALAKALAELGFSALSVLIAAFVGGQGDNFARWDSEGQNSGLGVGGGVLMSCMAVGV